VLRATEQNPQVAITIDLYSEDWSHVFTWGLD